MENNYTVYMHITPNNKKYIGITYRKPHIRWGHGSNYKNNNYFYNAIRKYGWENIKHEILYENLTKEEAEQKEKELIAQYKSSQREYGYNISLGGDFSTKGLHCNLGKKLSEETKEKLRKANLGKFKGKKNAMYGKKGKLSPCYGRKATIEQRKKISTPVYQFDKNGTLIKYWFGIREASRETGVDSGVISFCCQKKPNHKTGGGYIWSYTKNINIDDYIDNKIKKVIQYNEDTILKVWDSLSSFAKYYNISKSRASKIVIQNIFFNNSYWRYANEQKGIRENNK